MRFLDLSEDEQDQLARILSWHRDASAREVAEAAAPVVELQGADAAGIRLWRRITKALDANLRIELRKASGGTAKQIRAAARRGRANFDRNFPKTRLRELFETQYAKVHRVALRVTGDELSETTRELAAAVDPKRLARKWVSDQVRLLNKVAGQTTRDYLRTAREAGTATEVSKSLLSKALSERARVLTSRATFIGSNETHNAMARSTRAIYKGAGVEFETWNTQRDSKVRPEHRAREGLVFAVATGVPGPDGPEWPGTPHGCRCFSTPADEPG